MPDNSTQVPQQQPVSWGQRIRTVASSSRGGALLAALLVLAALLPIWYLIGEWYWVQLLTDPEVRDSLFVFQLGTLSVVLLLAGQTYLLVSRQSRLTLAVKQRTQEVTRINQQLEADITARKQAEEALTKWAHIFEHAEWGVAVGAADGSLLDMMNPAYAGMHGYTVEELIGKPIATVFAPGTQDELNNLIHTANETGHAVVESTHARKDGTIFPVLIDLTAVKNDTGQVLYRVANVQDITARKQVEMALRASEAELRALLAAMPDVILVLDAQGRYLRIAPTNPSFSRRPMEDLIGQTLHDVFPPDRADEFLESIQTALRSRQPVYAEYNLIVDDQEIWYTATISPMLDDTVLLVARDITERKRAEEALREREDQYRSIFESVSDALFITNLDGRLVDFNPAAAHMHGYTMEEFAQLQPAQFIHPDSLPLFVEYVETVRAGHPYRCQAVDIRQDGSLFHVDVYGHGFTYRGQPHILGVVRDITEQVQAQQLLEQRVAERTRELSTLLDVSRNIASTLELEPLLGLILDDLKVFVDYTSARFNTLEGQVMRVRAARGPTRPDRIPGMEFLASGPIVEEVVIRRRVLVVPDVYSPDDPWAAPFREEGVAHMETVLAHVRSWMGVPLIVKDQVIGNLSLEHEQPNFYTARHAELALALANQVAVAVENARLFAEAQGKAVLEERQRLARELHDSVTQSLYSLTLLAEAGRRLAEADEVQQAKHYLMDIGDIAQQALKEMRLLVYQLRPLALEREGLIGALQARLDSVEKRSGVEARLLIEGSLGSLSPVMEEELFRIAQEALNNALKHASARSVLVRLQGDDECVTLEVADNGRGIDPQTSGASGGLGLISIQERAAQLHGTVTLHSMPGEGTRVLIEVPRHAGAA